MSSSSDAAASARGLDPYRQNSAEAFEGGRPCEARLSSLSRASRPPGMSFGHELLLAVIMAVAMGATLFLYR